MQNHGFKFLHYYNCLITSARKVRRLFVGANLFIMGLIMMAGCSTQGFAQEAAKPATSPSQAQSPTPSTKEFPAVEFNDPAFQFRSVTPTKKGGIVIRALKADQNLPQRLELIVRDKDGNEKKVELSALSAPKKGPKLPEFRGHFTPESGDWGSVIGLELRFALPQLGGKKSIPGTSLDLPVSTNP